jgi:hypothetical protein
VESKQQILTAIEELPEGARVEEAVDKLSPLCKVGRGLPRRTAVNSSVKKESASVWRNGSSKVDAAGGRWSRTQQASARTRRGRASWQQPNFSQNSL